MPVARADVRDVWFAHWPVAAADLDRRLPPALAPATREGSAWASVLVQVTRAGIRGLPVRFAYRQVALRTYVRPARGPGTEREHVGVPAAESGPEADVGVFFLWVGADSRIAALGGRHAFRLPFHRVPLRTHDGRDRLGIRTGGGRDRLDVRVGEPTDPPVYQARFERTGEPETVRRDGLVGWLTERYRYYRADGVAGTVAHPPWQLAAVDGRACAHGLFEVAGIPEPQAAPVCRYSPGTDIVLVERP